MHITRASGLAEILKAGLQPGQVPVSRIAGDRTSKVSSSLNGILVNTYPHGFGILPYITSNVLPVALKIETLQDCEIVANDSYVLDEYIFGVPQVNMEKVLRDQAGFVLDIYGSTVLSAKENAWKISGVQSFDSCLLRQHESSEAAKQRLRLLEVAKLAYFQHLLRMPMGHEISRKVAELSALLCEENPFVPFDGGSVADILSRCGGRESLLAGNPILSTQEISALQSAPEAIQAYMKSSPEPKGVKPPAFDTSEPGRSDRFDEYVKAKYLKKPPPPPPTTYAASPTKKMANSIESSRKKKT